jgi:large subunit ribosomal protein L3
MAMGIVGRKAGMTRIFTEDGASVPVTVIEATPNRVSSVRTLDRDGYEAIQVAVGERKASRVNKPEAGHLAKAGVEAGRGLCEIGGTLTVEQFQEGQMVDVRGTTKGAGFAGVVKRHNFRMQRATHGNSLSHRAPGSIGQCQTPGRVFKGKKMAGHMGNVKRSAQNLEIIRVDAERNLILVKGSIPGSKGGDVIVTPAVKMKNRG